MTLDTFDLYDLDGEIYDLEDDFDYDTWSDEEDDWSDEEDDSYADSEWLTSAGLGTDEDYGYYGDDF